MCLEFGKTKSEEAVFQCLFLFSSNPENSEYCPRLKIATALNNLITLQNKSYLGTERKKYKVFHTY